MMPLHYCHEDIVWLEVPGETSLAYQFTGCPIRCQGCHSAHSWKVGSGQPLRLDYFQRRLAQYQHLISCVLFMGGEWCADELLIYLQKAREAGLKTCLYTGLERHEVPPQLLPFLDYLKTGPWVAALGGLDSPHTNQRFFELPSGAVLNHLFHKEGAYDTP